MKNRTIHAGRRDIIKMKWKNEENNGTRKEKKRS